MYTGLRCKVIVKEKYRKDLSKVLKSNDFNIWKESEFSLLRGFGLLERSSFIPFGALSYMDWDENDTKFNYRFCEKSGYWSFQCSLKNYCSEIETFVSSIIPEICECIIFLETKYEEDETSFIYEFDQNGDLFRYKVYSEDIIQNISKSNINKAKVKVNNYIEYIKKDFYQETKNLKRRKEYGKL